MSVTPWGNWFYWGVQRWDLIFVHGLVKFLPALALLFCLALPGSCFTRSAKITSHLCTAKEAEWLHGRFLSSVINVISASNERNTFYLMDLRKECIRYLHFSNQVLLKKGKNILPDIKIVKNLRLIHSPLDIELWPFSKEKLSQQGVKAMGIQRQTFILSHRLRDGSRQQTYLGQDSVLTH